ncbi:MAG: ergothioneine biosynthesis protein EgtB [Isosphaeraceae bacterium]
MPTNLADAPPGEIGDPGPGIADLELDRIAAWSCYQEVRRTTEALCAPLEIEDYVIQSMPDASPAKWHLAHTSWFFETFVLASVQPGFEPVDSEYSYLFNSYYNAVGERIARDRRGVLSRPTVAEVFRYRAAVDKRMKEFLDRAGDSAFERVRSTLILGLHHEQQHQELILTDIKHALASNPRRPAYRERRTETVAHAGPGAPGWIPFVGSVRSIGHESASFAFDNEGPRHQQYVAAFALADRLVTNREYLTFMDDGGYERPEFWLSDGWYARSRNGWTAPLYWESTAGGRRVFTLEGMLGLDLDEPVCHVSYYEADAFARWAGARLPTEAEWERSAMAPGVALEGNFLESGRFHPAHPMGARETSPRTSPMQLYGDVWEWTQSPYTPYRGFRPSAGALGEYNGKFMCNQFVLRGGSCCTPRSHIRPTYRNFFPPEARWQFSGIRLARDV